MSNYIVTKNNAERKIIKVTAENYYTFTPKSSMKESIKTITIYDFEKISKIVVRKLMIKYQKLLDKIREVEDDETAEGYESILDELNKLFEMLEYKYKKYLKKELYDNFIEDLSNIKEFVVIGLEKKSSIRR